MIEFEPPMSHNETLITWLVWNCSTFSWLLAGKFTILQLCTSTTYIMLQLSLSAIFDFSNMENIHVWILIKLKFRSQWQNVSYFTLLLAALNFELFEVCRGKLFRCVCASRNHKVAKIYALEKMFKSCVCISMEWFRQQCVGRHTWISRR